MFKAWGTWLGLEDAAYTKKSDDSENSGLAVEEEEKIVQAQNEVNKQQAAEQKGDPTDKEEQSQEGKGLGGRKISPYHLR